MIQSDQSARWTPVFAAALLAGAVLVGFEAATDTASTFALVFLGTVGIGIGKLFSNWAAESLADRQFLFRIFTIGLLLRIAIAVFQYQFLTLDFFAPDQHAYHLIATRAAEALAESRDAFSGLELKQRFYVAYCTWLYYLCGSSILIPSVLNGIYGCVAAMVVYRITVMLDTPEAGRYAALLAVFTPSHMLWSSLNLRDTPTILALVAAVYFTLKLRRELSLMAVIGFSLSMLLLLGLRDYIFFITLGSLVIGYLGVRSGRTLEFLAGGILVLGAAMVIYQAAPSDNAFIKQASLAEIQTYRRGLTEGAESAYLVDADVSTPLGALLYFPIGLAYFLLAPFPWQWGSLRQAIAVPETLFMWTIIPATLAGLLKIAREKMNLVMPLFVLMAAVTISYSLVQGNVGTAFRHRAQVMIFVFIFSGIGLRLRREQPQKSLLPEPPPASGAPATANAPAG